MTAAATGTARQRLHPLTTLIRSAKFLVAAAVAFSWQGLGNLGFTRWLIAMGGLLVLGAIGALISWAVTGYEVIGKELRVYEGFVFRRTRAIPLERVQAIDVVRPLLARLLGLAELRLEVAGAAKTEAPLAYLSVADAARLRQRLIALVSDTAPSPVDSDTAESAVESATDASPAPAVTARPELRLHRINNRDLLIGQVLTPQAIAIPVGLAFTLGQALIDPVWTFIGIASTLTALGGVVQLPIRRVLDDWDFRIAVDRAGLRLRHGLLGTRSHTVPPRRIQAIRITWPLLWRRRGWQRTRIDVAGYAADDSNMRSGVLLPVAAAPVTANIAGMVLAGALDGSSFAPDRVYHLADLWQRLDSPPARAKWVDPLAAKRLGFALTDEVAAARQGVLTRELVVVPLARIQGVRVLQGPIQRRLGLATVHVDTAGGLSVAGRHRDAREAYALAEELARRSRAARRTASANEPRQ